MRFLYSMFMAKNGRLPQEAEINIINKGTILKGDVVSKGDIRIDGEVFGNIKTESRLVIGISGKVQGEIKCRNLEVAGTVEGKIDVTEHFSMKSSAEIRSEIKVGKISVEPGAKFYGLCSMQDNIESSLKKEKK